MHEKPNDLTLYTFIDGDLLMDVNVSITQRNVYMKQIEIAKLLEIDKRIVSKFIQKTNDYQMGQVTNLETKVAFLSQGVAKYYDLETIKEIGQKYNQDRIKKLEEWLENLIIENAQEVVDYNFRIVRYNQDNLDIPVRYDWETNLPWMTQKEISNLYGTTISAVNQHIKNIFEDEELDKKSVIKNYLNTGIDGKTYEVMLYNYDMILAIGYRTRTSKNQSFLEFINL